MLDNVVFFLKPKDQVQLLLWNDVDPTRLGRYARSSLYGYASY